MLDLLFQIINFLLFIIIAHYLFRKYLLGSIKHQIVQEYTYKQQLVTEREHLRSKQKEVEKELHEQQHSCQLLEKKVEQWRNVVEQTKIEQEKERIRLQALLEKKIEKQQELIALTDIQRKITPSIISELSQSLHSYYSEASHEQAYTQHVLDVIMKL